MGASLRAFIAFTPPEAILRCAQSLQDGLKARGLKLRWVKPANIHLTLKFLGDMPEAHIADVRAAMQQAVHEEGLISLALQGLGVFPSIQRPRILWTGLGGDVDRLRRLVGRLEDGLEPLGFKKEKRAFKAHLTLARVKARLDTRSLLQGIQELGEYAPVAFDARQMVLYQSELRPTGAVYTERARVSLG